jgi:hypothetical protein
MQAHVGERPSDDFQPVIVLRLTSEFLGHKVLPQTKYT